MAARTRVEDGQKGDDDSEEEDDGRDEDMIEEDVNDSEG